MVGFNFIQPTVFRDAQHFGKYFEILNVLLKRMCICAFVSGIIDFIRMYKIFDSTPRVSLELSFRFTEASNIDGFVFLVCCRM